MIGKFLKRYGKISINAFSSLFQVIIVGVSYFFLYKYLLKELGANALGLWSLIIASSSMANMGNLGVGGSIVKFVASSDATKNFKKIASVIHTGLLIVLVTIGLLAIALNFVLPGILSTVISPELFPIALKLIPLTLVSLVLNACANVFIATLEGLQFIFLKNVLTSALTLGYMILVFVLTPRLGLIGVAYAQIIQASLLLILNLIVVLYKVPGFSLARIIVTKDVFNELFGYGMKYQLISICALLFDPVTKYFLTNYAGLSTTGYYEMANKLLTQLIALIVNAFKVLVPVIANKSESQPSDIKKIFINGFPVLFTLTACLITYIISFDSYISVLWIGKWVSTFSSILIIISCGWFFNTIGILIFYINLGTGALKWNVYSQLGLFLSNALLCFLVGKLFGGIYTILGTAFSLLIGAVIIFYSFFRTYHLSVRDVFGKNSLLLVISSVLIMFISNYSFRYFSSTISFWVLLVVNFLFVTLFLFVNPALKDLKNRLYLFSRK